MEDRQEKSIVKRLYRSRLFLVLALIVSLFVALGYSRAYYHDYKIRQEIRSLEEEYDRLKKSKLESLDLLEYVSGADFVEEKAREELNLKKPGERVIVIKRDSDQLQDTVIKGSEKKISNPRKWLNYFLHVSVDN